MRIVNLVPSVLCSPLVLAAVLALAGVSEALSIKSLYPVKGATGQCLDTPLRMVLSGKPSMAWNGAVRIRDLTNAKLVHTWTITSNPGDPQVTVVGDAWAWKDSVGNTKRNVWPVVLDSLPEFLAEVRVPQHLLQPNTLYQIEVDAGVLKGSDGSAFSGVGAGVWTFATTNSKPSSKTTVVVADDNSGDVCSVQGGLELVPTNSKTPVQVLVKAGYYREMLSAKNKNNLRLYGAGVGRTVVRYMNSNNLNTTGSSERNLALLGGNGMQIRALSIINTASVTAGQAEALYLQGDTNVVADVFLHSFQDTWLNTGGRVYVQDATIEGSVDFIWGYTPVFFKRCNLVLNRTGGVVVQPRNTTTHGYVFESCVLSAYASGYSGCNFARDGGASYATGEVMYLNTTIRSGSFLDASPWTISTAFDASKLRFCEYQSKDQSGTLITIADAQRKAHQCSADSATEHATPSFVLGGWNPAVPALASVLGLFEGLTEVRKVPPPEAGARLIRSMGNSLLDIANPGFATVREILPNGTTRILFSCQAPCREKLESKALTPSWLEIVQAGTRTILSNPMAGGTR